MNNETNATLLSTSTGPTSPEGKAISSQNAVKEGLYTREAFIRPGEEAEYEKLFDRFMTDLLPDGILENVFVTEIVNATWRLRRCALVEGRMADRSLFDPMEDEGSEKVQRSVDRARAQSHNIIRRSMAELRKLQTERATRRELEVTHAESVLVDSQKVERNVTAKSVREATMQKLDQELSMAEIERYCAPPTLLRPPVAA